MSAHPLIPEAVAGISLHGFLSRLIWLCILPLLLLGAWLAADSVLTKGAERDLEATNLARNFATAIDQHLSARIAALNILAVSPLIDDKSRWGDLYQEAEGFRQSFGSHVILAEAEEPRQMLFNTREPFGTPLPPLPKPKGQAAAPTALATLKPAVGDTFFGPVARELLVAIAVPVLREGRAVFVLITTFEARQFQQRLEQLALPSGWVLSLLDGRGDRIARRAPPGLEPGQEVDTSARFVVKSTVAAWSVVLEIPHLTYRMPLVEATLWLVAALLVATLIAVLGGRLASRRLAREVAALVESPASPVSPPAIREIDAVRQRLEEAAQQRAAAETRQRESETRYRELVQNANSAIIRWSRDGRILFFNEYAQAFFGWSAEEVIGQHVGLLVPTQESTGVDLSGLVQDIVDHPGRYLNNVNENICRDGRRVWMTWTNRAIHGEQGQVTEILAVGNDITERKRIEEALRESERTYRSLFEGMLNGCAHCRMLFEQGEPVDFIYLHVNRAFETLTGLRNVEGRPVSEVIPGIRQSDPGVFEIYGRVALGGQPERFEIYVEAMGMWFAISVYSPEPGHFVAVFDVITERKLAEQEIHRLNAELERRIAQRTAELAAANRELESFAYAVSHDLRAPLRAMSGFSQALIEDYGHRLHDEARAYLEQIDLAAHKMATLIDGLLTLSRSTRGELRRDTLDLSELAQRLLGELAQGDPQRRVAVEIQSGLLVRGDGRLLEVVLRNLLGNAWKYSARAAEPRIRLYAEEEEGRNWICLADNGAGFDMAHAAKLFQPFQRLHRQEEFPGLGIGLATVQRILHRHGGEIRARGEPGQGATFCFSLPAEPGTDQA